MGVMTRILQALGYERRDAAEPSWRALAGSGAVLPVDARAAEGIATLTACVSAIATAISTLPIYVYQVDGDKREEVHLHPLLSMARRGPNEFQSWPEMVEAWLASTLLHGNGLLAIERDGATLTALRFIPWNWVTIVQLPSGRLAYDVSEATGQLGRIGRSYRLLAHEVVHLKDRSDDGRVGRSRLSRGAETIQAALTTNQFAASFLANGAAPSGAIISEQQITDETAARIRDYSNDRFKGAHNAGQFMVLSGGLSFQPFQISPEDAELLESRRFGVEEICRLFQVPPPLVQDYAHNTFTNSEQASTWFAQFSLMPWVRKIEAAFDRALFPAGSGFEVELGMSSLMRADPESRWQSHKIAVEAGILTANEVREIEGFEPMTVTEGLA